jgi:YVTN family beta-propeller protein
MMLRLSFLLAFAIAPDWQANPPAAPPDAKVGPTPDGGTVVTTGQSVRPAGEVVELFGRPVDLAVSPDGTTVFAKDNRGLVVLDAAMWKVKQELPFPKGTGGASMHGIAVSRNGRQVYATTSNDKMHIMEVGRKGLWEVVRSVELPGTIEKPPEEDDGEAMPNDPPPQAQKTIKSKTPSYPTGIALFADGKRAMVCLSRNNTVVIVDLTTHAITATIPVGVAPYAVVLNANESKAFVSNWGGRRARKGDRTANSSGTPVVVDERGVGASGTVGRIDLVTRKMDAEVSVGLHPAGMALVTERPRLYVANANSDTVSVIDPGTMKVLHTVTVRPVAGLPFGSGTNALGLSKDGTTLFAANGGNNAVAVLDVAGDAPKVSGFIPAGWFPGAVSVFGDHLFIANVKGTGSRRVDPKKGGFNSHQHTGTIQKTAVPDAAALAASTQRVIADARIPQVLATMETARPGVRPVPVPARPGEPSVIEHVVYVIKENRTYDQVFGDFADPNVYPLPKGNGEPKLCIFGKAITPNHHALAETFVLLDNFYCNGVLSADGHSWVTEGNVTDHLEKAFGGFNRSYTYGDDPLTYSSTGFLWDNALLRGRTVRNYGELVTTETRDKSITFKEIYADYTAKTARIKFEHKLGIAPLWERTCQDFPGWNMNITDQQRVDVFIRELKTAEKKGEWANLTMLYLPQDHASGTTPGMPTPSAHIADNDLALGRAVEAISQSRFWPKTVIFVVEDDPQDGWDHVDGHRSISLVISPYTKRNAVVSKFYNQTSVVHTIEQILGLPPMNQQDALAPLMTDCFTETPDFTPFKALPVTIPLDQLNPPKEKLSKKERELAEISERQNFEKPDRVNDDEMNRVLWHAMKGVDVPYPAEWAGAHGRGFKELKLKHGKK